MTPSPWLPIETAPKDRTLVDLWADDRRLINCFFGHEWDKDEARKEYLYWFQLHGEDREIYSHVLETPTHWMPRPENPD